MSLHRLLGATAMAAALAYGAGAAAQDAEVEGIEVIAAGSQVELPPAYAGGQVATGGRVGMFGAVDTMDSAYSATAYTEALIFNQQARSVADVLRNDPMVRVAKGFGNFQELYVIRGFPVYSDDMTYNGVYGVLPRQFIAAEFLERVEVFHGASAFLNGAAPGGSGVGGAVNLVPKRAPDDGLNRLTLGTESGGELYGAADLARRFGDSGDFGVRLNLAGRDGENAVGEERELFVGGLGADYRGERLRFSADLGYQDHHIDAPRPSVTPFGGVPEAPDADANFAQPWTYTDERQLFGVVRGEYEITPEVTVWAAVGGRDGEERNVLANPSSNTAGVTSAYRFDNTREDRIFSADGGVRFDVTTGDVGHRFVVSAARTLLKSRNAYAFSDFTGFAGDLYEPVAVSPPAANFFVGGALDDPNVTERSDTASLALADMMSFMGGRLLATVGVRYQVIQTESFDYNSGVLAGRYKNDAVTPALGLVYKPTDTISLYGNYSEALQPGQIAPAFSGSDPVLNAGEALSPFRSKQYEMGAKYDAGDFGGTLSVFSTTLPTAYVDDGIFGDFGEQENRGVELSLYGEPLPGLRLLGGATYLDAELAKTPGGLSDGQTPIGVPEFQANANVEWDLPFAPGLTVDGRLIYTGAQYVDTANVAELDSWTRLDLGVRYAFTVAERDVSLRARVENVTDENYWASAGGYPGSNYLVLGGPRAVVVSASVDF